MDLLKLKLCIRTIVGNITKKVLLPPPKLVGYIAMEPTSFQLKLNIHQ